MSPVAQRSSNREPDPPASRNAVLIGRVLKGRYRIVRMLGHGAMGNVYEVVHEGLRTAFAVKQLRAELDGDPSIAARFRHEAEVMAQLAHPNIVRVFDIDVEPGFGTWIAMELIHGEDLGTRLRRLGKLPVAEAVRIAGQVAAALDRAHRAGVVHRDIKPPNVLIEAASERALLTDFGIAKATYAHGSEPSTASGVFVGTYRYSSPEQLRNRHSDEIDGRADIYSLGVVLYEMVSGRRFLDGLSEGEIVNEVGFGTAWTPPLLYDMAPPPILVDVIARCVAPRREERIASAGELAVRLAAFAAGMPSTAAAPASDATAETNLVADDVVAAEREARGSRWLGRWLSLVAVVLIGGAIAALRIAPDRWISQSWPWTAAAEAGASAVIHGVQPEEELVVLTRRESKWFSVVLEGLDADDPPQMRWFLNDELVAESTTIWEYDPEKDLADLRPRGTVRFVLGSGVGARRVHEWATETSAHDLSPVLLNASYKPGTTITAKIGERIEIAIDAIDPDGDPLTFHWRVDGHPTGGDAPSLSLTVSGDAEVGLTISDGEVSVSSQWWIAAQ